MKNILNESPTKELKGRLLFSTKFTSTSDIKDKKILNIGCGFGWFELFALENNVNKICAIELSETDLAAAKNNIKDPRVEFKTGSAIEIPYENEIFDTVVSWEVIEHIPRNTEPTMFAEVNRVLKQDGYFYLSTPFRQFLSNVLDPAWWLIGHRHYSVNQLKNLGETHGFEFVEYQLKGGIWALLSLLNMYIAKWIFRRKPFYKEFFDEKNEIEYQENYIGYFNIFVKYKKK